MRSHSRIMYVLVIIMISFALTGYTADSGEVLKYLKKINTQSVMFCEYRLCGSGSTYTKRLVSKDLKTLGKLLNNIKSVSKGSFSTPKDDFAGITLFIKSGASFTFYRVNNSLWMHYDKESYKIEQPEFEKFYSYLDTKYIQKSSEIKTSDPFINIDDIKYIKMTGGLHINTKVLFPGHDDEAIHDIANLINKSIKIGPASDRDTGYIGSEARPIGVLFKMKNGKEVIVWELYEPNSEHTASMISKDKAILDITENGIEHFYRIKSNDLGEFFLHGSEKYMPLVSLISVVKSSPDKDAKENDTITVSGDGCIADEVLIYIVPNYNPKLKYLVGKVTPKYGKWEWSTTLKRMMKALDGTEFNIGYGYYDIMAQMGNMRTGFSGYIKFDNN